MGLDMYLNVRKYINKVARWENYEPVPSETFDELVKLAKAEDLVYDDGVTGGYVEIPVYYWRKANAVHQWFVDNYAGGVDECQPIYLPREALEKLIELCDIVIKQPDRASEHLPTVSGFFFGATDYDEWYIESLKETRDAMKKLLSKLTDEFDLIYQASW